MPPSGGARNAVSREGTEALRTRSGQGGIVVPLMTLHHFQGPHRRCEMNNDFAWDACRHDVPASCWNSPSLGPALPRAPCHRRGIRAIIQCRKNKRRTPSFTRAVNLLAMAELACIGRSVGLVHATQSISH